MKITRAILYQYIPCVSKIILNILKILYFLFYGPGSVDLVKCHSAIVIIKVIVNSA